MITDKLQLTSAFTFSPKADLSSINQRFFATIITNESTGQEFALNEIEANLEADGLRTTDLTLPTKTSFGLGIGQPRQWFVGAEYSLLKASEFSNEIVDNNTIFEDATTISFGGFYIPKYNSFNSYFKRTVYRAGIRFEETGLKINNESINEFGISFGVGLPVGKQLSKVNLGFELGQRGEIANGLVKENYFNFRLSLTLNDRWFAKLKLD